MDKKELAFESALYRMDMMNKRLWLLCIALMILLLSSNLGWLYYELQYQTETTTTEITQDNDNGYNSYIGNDGDIYNGETDDKDNNN